MKEETYFSTIACRMFKKKVYIRIWLILVVTKYLKKIHQPEAEIFDHEVGNLEKVTVD